MIDQEPGHVHILGVPKPTSVASGVIWNALASDGLIGWHGGRLRYSGDSRPDDSAAVVTNADFEKNGVPSLFLDMLVSIDLEIPPAEKVIGILDRHVTNISLNSAAFSIPAKADIADLAACVAASRIATECREHFQRPSGINEETMVHSLHLVGLYALATGGSAVYSEAKLLVNRPDFWTVSPDVDRPSEFGGTA
jgi:hypothetical protein